jgi:PIN domain nuclease of toxin-antitoxin system
VKALLDTCTFLWILLDAEDLSARARAIVTDPANDLFFSAASAWEIVLKHALGRLPLPALPERYVPQQRERHGIESLPVSEEAALHISRLPRLHADPFDRILVSQAIVHGLVLLTPDPDIARYPARIEW